MSGPSPAQVGAFVLGGIALAVAGLLFFGSTALFSRSVRATVFFQGSVDGLSAGSPVTFRGVPVGSVTSVALVMDVKDLHARIPVELKLEPGHVRLADQSPGPAPQQIVQRLIGAGLHAELVEQSLLTGEMSVELDLRPDLPSHFVAADTRDVPEIPAMASEFQTFRKQIGQAPIIATLDQAQHTMAAIEAAAKDIDGDLGPLTSDLARDLDSAKQMMDTGRTSIVGIQHDASQFLTQGTGLARDGRQQLTAAGGELARALNATDRAVRSANELFVSANGLVAPRSYEREDLDSALRDLADATSTLRSFARTVDRNPSVLLSGRSGP